MKFKDEFVNAVTLFLLLLLLFWSCTWNLTDDFDFSRTPPRPFRKLKVSKDISYARSDVTVHVRQHSVLTEGFSVVRYGSRKSSKSVSTSDMLIPPFNEWKQKEMIKYEKGPLKDGSSHHNQRKQMVHRKLNYASSKCGAKILASNPEARHRIAVLSEKSDEYMLNPCRVTTWFIIELCDTVEVTQIELANYELYSSSPKEFSVLWSEVFPTVVWHLLGTFVAKDQRTMQTFEVNTKNLGKFIKVIIYSHHGKEHYCPLSMIRVLGYSMVQKLEDIEDEENNQDFALDNQAEITSDKNDFSKQESVFQESIREDFRDVSINKANLFSVKICSVIFMHCTDTPESIVNRLCKNKPICRFLVEVMKKSGTDCHKTFCFNASETTNKTFKSIYHPEDILSNLTNSKNRRSRNETALNGKSSNQIRDILKIYEHKKSTNTPKEGKDYITDQSSARYKDIKPIRWNSSFIKNGQGVKNFSKVGAGTDSAKPIDPLLQTKGSVEPKCVCEKISLPEGTTTKERFETENDDAIDSAGLLQKEYVLFKLTARMRAAELDLSLINKYLQQLSQSYRLQMEDMKSMFNSTVMAIGIASEKATIIDKKQDESINSLKDKIQILDRTIDYLMNGQRDLLKRVVELHAFFIILEFIIISTIFTIFLNIFQRKSVSLGYRIDKLNIWKNKS